MHPHIKKALIVTALVGAVFLAGARHIDRAVSHLGMGRVSHSNEVYLNHAFENALTGFLLLSGIKSALAIVEGSEVGIGFNLEVGDAVQSVYDYVDIAWKTVLAGATILLLTKILLETATHIDHWCLALMLSAVLLFYGARWFRPENRKLHRLFSGAVLFFAVLSMGLYFILPISISGSALLSKQISQPLVQESREGFEQIKTTFSTGRLKQIFAVEEAPRDNGLFPQLDIAGRVGKAKELLAELGREIEEETRHMAVLTIKLIAGYLFDCILFPLTFFFILYLLTKTMMRTLFDLRRRQYAQADLEAVVKKYFIYYKNLHKKKRGQNG